MWVLALGGTGESPACEFDGKTATIKHRLLHLTAWLFHLGKHIIHTGLTHTKARAHTPKLRPGRFCFFGTFPRFPRKKGRSSGF